MDTQLEVVGNKGPCCSVLTLLPLLVALGMVAGSLALTWGMGLKACPLCLYQRAFAMGAAAVLLMGLVARSGDARLLGLLALPLAAAGLKVAAFHVYLEAIGKLECPAGIAGIGSAPQQAFMAFALLLVSLIPALASKSSTACCRATAIVVGLVLGGFMGYACVKSAPPAPQPPKPYDKPLDEDGCRPPYVEPAAAGAA